MPNRENRGVRSQWTTQQLNNAIHAIHSGMSKNAASQRYKIPRRTLTRYFNKNVNEKIKMGRKTTLTVAEESELARRIVRLAQVGYPLTNKIVRKCVFTYCKQNNIPNIFSKEKEIAGRYWLKGFLQRNPEISKRKAQGMNPARAQKLNKFIVGDYFMKLRQVLTDLDIMDKPERVYNVDEKGCRLSLHHQQTVLAKKGCKRVHLVAPEHGQNVTVVACGSASGVAIPPAILFKGSRMKPEWKDDLPPGTLALMTPKGSMNIESFKLWIEHLAKYKLEGKCLLIFDGASCHLDHSIVEIADRYEITLLCLPSNTTHELQPMDKSVFRSFEHHWDQQVLLYWAQHKDRSLTKQRFGEIFSNVWDKAMTPANIRSGFRATGIFPYNPDAIPEEAFAPSLVTEQPRNDHTDRQGHDEHQRTPSPKPGCSSEHPQLQKTSSPQPGCSSGHPSFSKSLQIKKRTSRQYSTSSDSSASYTTEESSDDDMDTGEDNNPGSSKLNQSFSEFLETPDKVSTETKNKRKAINSRALIVKKAVFANKNDVKSKNKQTNKKQKTSLKKANNNPKAIKNGEKWFCKLCKEDKVLDMRICSVCLEYVHEECVGLTKKDKAAFICPDCSP